MRMSFTACHCHSKQDERREGGGARKEREAMQRV
jgi:hypothetical protein